MRIVIDCLEIDRILDRWEISVKLVNSQKKILDHRIINQWDGKFITLEKSKEIEKGLLELFKDGLAGRSVKDITRIERD